MKSFDRVQLNSEQGMTIDLLAVKFQLTTKLQSHKQHEDYCMSPNVEDLNFSLKTSAWFVHTAIHS